MLEAIGVRNLAARVYAELAGQISRASATSRCGVSTRIAPDLALNALIGYRRLMFNCGGIPPRRRRA
jgi:hypothetical protein